MKATRRGFLKTICGGALTALAFLYPGSQKLAGLAPQPQRFPSVSIAPAAEVKQVNGPDPTFASGEVIEKTSNAVILKSAESVRAVRFENDTVVWKEFEVTFADIQLQDWLDVKGTPLEDGTLLAQSGWVFVNIGRREGVVENLTAGRLVIRQSNGTESIELSSRLEVITADDGKLLAGGVAALKPGTQIGMVGLRLPNGGFRATRIWTQ